MAHLNNCEYCGKTIVNAAWHPECRIEYLEDLIARIQKHIDPSSTQSVLPHNLQKEISAEQVRTKAEFEKRRRNKGDRKQKKEFWKMARHDYLQKCAEQFEKKHPDPIMYG